MKLIDVEVLDPKEVPPPTKTPVIVWGGPAMWDGYSWYSMAEHPYREIQWKVDWWCRFPTGNNVSGVAK